MSAFEGNEEIKRPIETLAEDTANTTNNTKEMETNQVSPLEWEIQSKIATYQNLEREYRVKKQEQFQSQFLIVNPDTADDERAAVADASSLLVSQSGFQTAVSSHTAQVPTLL